MNQSRPYRDPAIYLHLGQPFKIPPPPPQRVDPFDKGALHDVDLSCAEDIPLSLPVRSDPIDLHATPLSPARKIDPNENEKRAIPNDKEGIYFLTK